MASPLSGLSGLRVSAVFAVVTFALAACEHSTVLLPPPEEGDTDDDSSAVQRADLTLKVGVVPEDSALAARLGAEDGRLPAAEVTVTRIGDSSVEPEVTTTDDAGVAHFSDLLPGNYDVSILRLLADQEIAALGEGNEDVTAFGGGGLVTLEAPATDTVVKAVAGRSGSLVLSEFFAARPRVSSGGQYRFGHYIEVYNNADTLIYLDGKVFARGIPWLADYSELSCDRMAQWRLDPEGIWTGFRYKFPGAGMEYPLEPGTAAIIATDAIDHREFADGMQDLSVADFEFIGSADVDNPGVPNMINMGPHESVPHLGHGQILTMGVWVVADVLEEEDLTVDYLPVNSPEHRRIPADAVLDVFVTTYTPEVQASLGDYQPCDNFVHNRFDRRRTNLYAAEELFSIRRRPFVTTPAGRIILQRTRTSARDFDAGDPTPGTIP